MFSVGDIALTCHWGTNNAGELFLLLPAPGTPTPTLRVSSTQDRGAARLLHAAPARPVQAAAKLLISAPPTVSESL